MSFDFVEDFLMLVRDLGFGALDFLIWAAMRLKYHPASAYGCVASNKTHRKCQVDRLPFKSTAGLRC